MLTTKKAVCSGYANAFKLLRSSSGIPCEYVSGSAYTKDGYEGHAWNQVAIDNKWYNVDVTWCDDEMRYDYFLVPDRQIYLDHKTDNANHVCTDSLQEKALKRYFSDNYIANDDELRTFFAKKLSGSRDDTFHVYFIETEFGGLDGFKECVDTVVNEYNVKCSFCVDRADVFVGGATHGGGSGSNIYKVRVEVDALYNSHYLRDRSPAKVFQSDIVRIMKCENCSYAEETRTAYNTYINQKCEEMLQYINDLRKVNHLSELNYRYDLQSQLDQYMLDNKSNNIGWWNYKSSLEKKWESLIGGDIGKMLIRGGSAAFSSNGHTAEELILYFCNKEYKSVVISAVADSVNGDCMDCMFIYFIE